MKRKVYIETSIPSFYYEVRTDPQMIARREITRRWWPTERGYFELHTAVYTLGELARGTFPGKADALTMTNGIDLLQVVPRIEDIVSIYLQRALMSRGDPGDACHLAMASYYQVDYLLSWNCRHLANVNKQEHIKKVNEDIGLKVPILTTPQMLFSENAEGPDDSR